MPVLEYLLYTQSGYVAKLPWTTWDKETYLNVYKFYLNHDTMLILFKNKQR